MHIVAIGEILWDVFESGERLGGAPFNVAAHAARLGHRSALISAVGDDELGRRALAQARELGVEMRLTRVVSDAPTGRVLIELRDGQPDYTIERPAAYDFSALDDAGRAWLRENPPDWFVFGTLNQTADRVFELTRQTLEAFPRARRFYDVNLRKDSYTKERIADLLGLATTLKLNVGEVERLAEMFGDPDAELEAFCRRYADRWDLESIVITLGEEGSALWTGGELVRAPGFAVEVRDAVGAGDAFSAAFLHGTGQGLPPREVASLGNRVGALVASRDGAVPEFTLEDAWALEETA